MEPNDGRRRLLDLDPSGVSQEEGDESREWMSTQGDVESRVLMGLRCKGSAGGGDREVMVREKVSGPSIKEVPIVHRRGLVGEVPESVEWEHRTEKIK